MGVWFAQHGGREMSETEIVAVHKAKGLALLSNDEVIPMEAIEDEDKFVFIAGPDTNGNWYSVELDDFVETRIN